MQEMFDKRMVSLKKLAAKQMRPVQPVAPRPEAFIKSPLSSPGSSSHTWTSFNTLFRLLDSSFFARLANQPQTQKMATNQSVLQAGIRGADSFHTHTPEC